MFKRENWKKKPDVLRLLCGVLLLAVAIVDVAVEQNALGVCFGAEGIWIIVSAFRRVPELPPPEDIPVVERYAKSLQGCTDGELASILNDTLRCDEVKEAARTLLASRRPPDTQEGEVHS